MNVENLQENYCKTSELAKFYEGKSIFISGASGFLGEVLLEILLRCCPGILKIYILIRPKNGLQPDERKEKIFKRELFHKLKEENPDVFNKVFVVSGDVSLDNLGMCEKDYQQITKDVSIVFHVAASISLIGTMRLLTSHNVIGTDNVIELCKKLNKLEALVYTSSLFSNINRRTFIDEIVYKLPFKPEEVVRLSRNGNMDALNDLYSQCNPNFLNYYTFSKCVAENLLAENARDLPVSIIRPSMIINCLKGALPGYIKDGSALYNMILAIGKGFVQVVKVCSKHKLEFVPADIAANTHIVAAFLQATKSVASPSVYNCTSALNPDTWEDFIRAFLYLTKKYPFPNSYIKPNFIVCSNPLIYKFFVFILHLIPAAIVDTYLWTTNKKLRLLKLYKFQERVSSAAERLLLKQWIFKCENFASLSEKLNETDAEIFNVDMTEFKLEKCISHVYTGFPPYRVNGKLYEDTLTACFLRNLFTYLYRGFQLGGIAVLCYFVFLLYKILIHIFL